MPAEKLLKKIPKNLKWIFLLFSLSVIVFLCWNGMQGEGKAADFFQRYYMGILIQHGLDPVKLASCNLRLPMDTMVPANFSPMHIDFPWTQGFFLLFSFFPSTLSIALFYTLQICCLFFCMLASWLYLTGKNIERLSAAVLVSFFYLTPYVRTDFNVGNTGILALAGMFLVYEGWMKKRNWLEAIGLFLLCMKPQTGFLFVILLLMKKHFSTLILTGSFCFLFSLPGMFYLHKIPWNFLSEMFSIGSHFIKEPQICGLGGILFQPSRQTLIMGCNAIISLVILFFYLYRYSTKDPMLCLLPAAICSIFWSYSRIYHFLFLIIPLICLMDLQKGRNCDSISKIAILLVILIWLPVRQYFSVYIFFLKYVISIIALFFIGHFKGNTSNQTTCPTKNLDSTEN